MTVTRKRVYPTEQIKDPLAPLAYAIREHNPFENYIHKLDLRSAAEPDVSEIHDKEFNQVTRLAERAARDGKSTGLVLWGQQGVGKSHFLSRLSSWAEQGHALLVPYYNLKASPEELPRTVLQILVSCLTLGRADAFEETPLFATLDRTIRNAIPNTGKKGQAFSLKIAKETFKKVIDKLLADTRADLRNRTVYDVLFLFYWSSHSGIKIPKDEQRAYNAVRWLSGDSIDKEDANQLQVFVDTDVAQLADAQQIKQALVALAKLYQNLDQPVILCFDQVDILETDQVSRLSRFLHDILDSAANLMVITSGVQASLLEFVQARTIAASSWDRIAERKIQLNPITSEEGQLILKSRLEKFARQLGALPDAAQRALDRDVLFPLGTDWLQKNLAGKAELSPRVVINLAKERWYQQEEQIDKVGVSEWLNAWPPCEEGGKKTGHKPPPDEAIDVEIDKKHQDFTQSRIHAKQEIPLLSDYLANLLHSVLSGYGAGISERSTPKQGYDLLIRPPGGAITKILCLVTSSGRTATPKLKRFADEGPQRRVLLTDERMPLPPGKVGKEQLDKLLQLGQDDFRHVELIVEQYASLLALDAVVGMAKSKDIEVESTAGPHKVTPAEVIESHHRRGRYQAHPLLRLLLGLDGPEKPPEEPGPRENKMPDEAKLRTFILGELALAPGRSSQEMRDRYRQKAHADQLDAVVLKDLIEKVAHKMNEEKLLIVRPLSDGLMLMARPRQSA